MGSVPREDAPARLVRGLPAYPVGMVLLARLAVDRRHQGSGLGGTLVAEALRKAVAAGEAAARLVVVDAIDENAARSPSDTGASLRLNSACASTAA